MIDSHIGIDIAKFKFDVGIISKHNPVKHRTFPNNQEGFEDLILWLESELFIFEAHFCMEATGRYGEQLAFFLHNSGRSVSVVNPCCIKNYARSKLRRTKTDKVDALIIAEYCLKETPALWQPKSQDLHELQEMSRELPHLKDSLGEEKNRLKAGQHFSAVLASIESRIKFLKAQIAELEQLINSHIDQNQKLSQQKELLLTIPGIGETTANFLLAEIPAIENFKSVRQLVAFAGLVPREQSSGTLKSKTRLSKVGSSRIRRILYLPAVSSKRYNPVIINLCSRIEASGKSKMVAIGAAMRKLLHIIFGVLKTGKPFNPKLHLLKT